MELILSLIAGALGGNAAGKTMKNIDLGLVGNSIAGLIGGGLGGQLLAMMMQSPAAGTEAMAGGDIGSIIGSLLSGGVGGGVLMAVVGAIRQAMAK